MPETASFRVYEFGANGSRRIVELTSRGRAMRMVRAGVIEEALDWDGVTVYYRRLQPKRRAAAALGMRDDGEIVSVPSCAALTRNEVEAVVGTAFKFGKSRTAGMSEEKRTSRMHPVTHRVMAAEDLVELATAKLQAWKQVGPAIAALHA